MATLVSVLSRLQGFSKEITFPRERWVGYIKDYDSANLMMVCRQSVPSDTADTACSAR